MPNNLEKILKIITDAPVWIQEVIFIELKNSLENKLAAIIQPDKDTQMYSLFVPELTFKGKKELETHEQNLDFNIYKYLKCASQNMRVIDITLNNFWTLEESSKYLAECIKNEFIKSPENIVLNASIFYLGNEIRIGEYVKRLNRINAQELDDVLRKQKLHNEQNPEQKLKSGEIMINMGYVANKDIDKILFLKDEAKKRFLLPNTLNQEQVKQESAQNNDSKLTDLTQKIEKLSAENKLLKDKLRAIFNIQNKHK